MPEPVIPDASINVDGRLGRGLGDRRVLVKHQCAVWHEVNCSYCGLAFSEIHFERTGSVMNRMMPDAKEKPQRCMRCRSTAISSLKTWPPDQAFRQVLVICWLGMASQLGHATSGG